MRGIVALATAAALSSAALAQVNFDPQFEVGDEYVVEQNYSFSISFGDVTVQATSTGEVIEVEDGIVTLEIVTDYERATLAGAEQMLPPPMPLVVRQEPNGAPIDVEGGPSELDAVDLLLIQTFVVPTFELDAGDEYEMEIEGVPETGMPALLVEGTYVGMDDGLHMFESKLTEDVNNGLVVEGTYWLDDDGMVVRIEADFENLFVAISGEYADGEIVVALVD